MSFCFSCSDPCSSLSSSPCLPHGTPTSGISRCGSAAFDILTAAISLRSRSCCQSETDTSSNGFAKEPPALLMSTSIVHFPIFITQLIERFIVTALRLVDRLVYDVLRHGIGLCPIQHSLQCLVALGIRLPFLGSGIDFIPPVALLFLTDFCKIEYEYEQCNEQVLPPMGDVPQEEVPPADTGRNMSLCRKSPNNSIPAQVLEQPFFGTYTVKSGDTLSKIARAHGMNYRTLMNINNISSHLIYPGQNRFSTGTNKRFIRHQPLLLGRLHMVCFRTPSAAWQTGRQQLG